MLFINDGNVYFWIFIIIGVAGIISGIFYFRDLKKQGQKKRKIPKEVWNYEIGEPISKEDYDSSVIG
jgi:hypothetical protein